MVLWRIKNTWESLFPYPPPISNPLCHLALLPSWPHLCSDVNRVRALFYLESLSYIRTWFGGASLWLYGTCTSQLEWGILCPTCLPLPSHGSAGSHDLFRPLFSALFLCEFFWKPFCLFLGVWSLILVLWKSTCTVNYLLTYREKDKDYLKHTVGCLFFSLERVYNLVCLMLGWFVLLRDHVLASCAVCGFFLWSEMKIGLWKMSLNCVFWPFPCLQHETSSKVTASKATEKELDQTEWSLLTLWTMY